MINMQGMNVLSCQSRKEKLRIVCLGAKSVFVVVCIYCILRTLNLTTLNCCLEVRLGFKIEVRTEFRLGD